MNRLLLKGVAFISFASAFVLVSPMPSQGHDGHGAEKLGVQVEQLATTSKEWDGKDLPVYPKGKPEVKVLKIMIPAGVKLPFHTHPVINAAVILEGALELELLDGTTKVFKEGEALVEVVNTIHSGKATGQQDVKLIVIYAGIQGTPTTILFDNGLKIDSK